MPQAAADPTAWSLLPPIVAIGVAFWTRQVLFALACGVLCGSAALLATGSAVADANPLTRFLLPAVGSTSFAQILLIYLWCLGGLIGLWERTGGARHFAETIGARVAKGPRSALLFSWIIGVVFHQGGTISTVLAGTTVKPVADGHRIAHEELAYVVDSTASPVATVLPFNAWPAFIAGLIVGTVPNVPDTAAATRLFFSAVPFNFYAMFAVLGTLLFALGVTPPLGRRMASARARARDSGALDSAHAEPLLPPDLTDRRVAGYAPSLLDFFVPLGTLLVIAIVPYALGQLGWIAADQSNWINEAFCLALLSAMVTAKLRGMALKDVIDGFVSGCQAMTIGALVLALAVTLGQVAKELDTARFIVTVVSDWMPVWALPAVLTVLCMGIAFATGSAWGTYAVVFPVALPLAWELSPDPTYQLLAFGAVLGGGVFGDQCSPISDTTILSSMFTGCDLLDHVRTQLPAALTAAGLGAVVATVIAVTL